MYQIETIATILEDAGVAYLGRDLFIYHSPAEVEDCTILFPSNDPPVLDPDTPGYLRAKFQTIVRSSSYARGIEKSQELAEALSLFELTVNDIHIKFCRPLYQARVFRRSDSGTLEFSITYEARYTLNK